MPGKGRVSRINNWMPMAYIRDNSWTVDIPMVNIKRDISA